MTKCDTMAKEKIIHARIDEETHEKLFEKCNQLGCSFTEYIQDVIRDSLEDEPSDTESENNELEPTSQKTEPTETPKAIIKRISYDGKTWIGLPQKSSLNP